MRVSPRRLLAAGAALLAAAAVAVPTASTAAAVPVINAPGCQSLPAPAADLLGATEVREALGFDGKGVRVGVISGSFDSLGGAAADVAAGLLPGPGNPCGREIPVDVVAEAVQPDDDEGRAMAQIVHGIAPGAELLFASPNGSTEADLATAIGQLQTAGADIIVDDLGRSDALAFERGASGAAVQAAVDAGILYVAAAGNYGFAGATGYPSAGYPISGWETGQYRPAPCPDFVVAKAPPGVAVDCADVDPGPGVDTTLGVTMPPGILFLPFDLYWGEPSGSVTTQFGVGVSYPNGLEGVRWGGSPEMPAVFDSALSSLEDTAPVDVELTIVRQVTPAAVAPPVSLIFQSDSASSFLLDMEYYRSEGSDTVGRSFLGHNADPATLGVAAVDRDGLALTTYSSGGPAPMLFGIPSPVTVPGPALAGLTDLPISFALDAPVVDGSSPFDGTSAAAPTVAAVAAIVLQADPAAGPARLREALVSTADAASVTVPWNPSVSTDRVLGRGLVDAVAAVAAVLPPPAPTPSVSPANPMRAGAHAALADSGGSPPWVAALFAGASVIMGIVAFVGARKVHRRVR